MEHGNSSRERRRLSKNINVSDFINQKNTTTQEYSFEKDPPKYLQNTSTPAKRGHTKNSNVRLVSGERNRQQNINNDDTNDEENTDEFTSEKQKSRRNSTSTEGTDENPSADDNVKGKVEESNTVLHKREKRRKKRQQRQAQDHRFSAPRQDNEENIDEDRNSMKQKRLTSGTSGRRDHNDGMRRQQKKRKRARGNKIKI